MTREPIEEKSAPDEDAPSAAPITVMISGGFRGVFDAVIDRFVVGGNPVLVVRGASTGTSEDTIPKRLARGETADLVILSLAAMEDLIAAGLVHPESLRELARSGIGMAVRSGAPKPRLETIDDLKQVLATARSIALSSSASGRHLVETVFPRLGFGEELAERCRVVVGEPVGALVARGEAEIGFQQIGELVPVEGIELVAPLPPEVQMLTPFVAGIPNGAHRPDAARRLVAHLSSSAVRAVVRAYGMHPAVEAGEEGGGLDRPRAPGFSRP